MLDHYFKRPFNLLRLRSGAAGPFLDGFAATLRADGYANGALFLLDAEHLGGWARRRGIEVTSFDEHMLDRFIGHLRKCRCTGRKHRGYRRTPFRLRCFLEYLRRTGVVARPTQELSRVDVLVEEYCTWMRHQRGLSEATLARNGRLIRALLETIGPDPAQWHAADLRKFVLDRVNAHERRSAKSVTTAAGSYLRFLVAQGRCSVDLIAAVPKVASWRLATLPRHLPADDVERILNACDITTPVGLRNRAMLFLLARLGLRAGDVVGLRLADIDWRGARLRVVGKGRRETWMPLPQDVGDALLAYLKDARPSTEDDHVFLSVCAPIGPIRYHTLSCHVAKAMRRAGIEAPFHGAHVLRHSLATRMLREGATLDTIGAVLRHRDAQTTALYSKVDVDSLRQIAQPWPGEEGSP